MRLDVADEPGEELGVEDDGGAEGGEGKEPVGENEVREELEAALFEFGSVRSFEVGRERNARCRG